MTTQEITEALIMAHRYLYYVKAKPVLTDLEYDRLEAMAFRVFPDSTVLNSPGSDLESSYTQVHKELAGILNHIK